MTGLEPEGEGPALEQRHAFELPRERSSARSFLILDDDSVEREIMRLTIGDAFPAAGILEAADAAGAHELCRTNQLDCVIVDYNLPGTDGLAFARELVETAPHLPVVLVTNMGDEVLAAKALRNGLADYIPKSRINVESIHRTLARAIHNARQARMIEEQREELKNFAYTLAHDFKQPIRQIRTFSQLVADELGNDGQSAEMRAHLKFLSEAARRLADLVDVMSQYTLLNQPPDLHPVNLTGVFETVANSIAPFIEERHGRVTFGSAAQVVGNETLMIQVMQNLIVNGLKYNRSATPHVDIRTVTHSGRCTIEVQDNGIGIEPAYLSDIFKPLVRLHTSAEYTGTGLGLTLARKAVVAQGGRIWCASEIGLGSTFCVDLALPTVLEPRREAARMRAAG